MKRLAKLLPWNWQPVIPIAEAAESTWLPSAGDHRSHVEYGIMYKAICIAFPIAQLILSPGIVCAADLTTCRAYANEAVAKALATREFGCPYDLYDPRWTTDLEGHAKWCRATDKHVVVDEAARRRAEIKICQMCRAYASLAATAAADNNKFKCGLNGVHWRSNSEEHFGWCMTLRDDGAGSGQTQIAMPYRAITVKMKLSLNLRTARRIQDIEECKLRQPQYRNELPPKS
jgi:hypothetical protein